MDTFIPYQLKEILQDDLIKFKKYVTEINPIEFNDNDDDSEDKLLSLFVMTILNDMSVLKQVKKKCLKSKQIDSKTFNKFIYISMKYLHKLEIGCWSFYEATILNIPAEEIRSTTLTYTIM